MPMPTPAQAAKNWQAGMANSGEKLKAGIQAVQESPMEKAAAAADRYAAGVQRSVSDGTYQAGLRAVSLQQWKDAAINKGVNRVASGAAAAVPKMQAFLERFLPHLANVVSGLPPRGDMETNIARATQVMRGNAQFRNR